METVRLHRGREHSALLRHPWIFSGAIESVSGEPPPGELVRVVSSRGEPVGIGCWSPTSQIRIRLVAFGDADHFSCSGAVVSAVDARSRLLDNGYTNAVRLINAEADGLPGVIADRYGDFIVCQFNTAGAERMRNEIVATLVDALSPKGVYERSDADGRKYEGLPDANRRLVGEEPPDRIEIFEGDVKFLVDVRNGHKTGFYLDQRENRRIVSSIASGLDVLNVFSYTGGFGVAAMKAGARSVVHVDLSAPSLALARENSMLNGLPSGGSSDFVEGNAFEVLRKFRDCGRSFDLVVLDPPKFADAKGHLRGAARGYKDINLLAMKLLTPGGLLATFSCSGLMTPDLFGKVVAEAAVDARRNFRLSRRLWQAPDHPEGLSFPEGLYLKGLLLQDMD